MTLLWSENNTNSGGKLTVDDHNGNVANVALVGQYTSSNFVLAGDGHVGTLVADPTTPQLPLFAQT